MAQEPAPASPTTGAIVFLFVTKTFDTLGLAIRYGAYVAIAWFAYLGIVELAGKITIANFAIAYFKSDGGAGMPKWVPWTCTGGALIWGFTERHLRKKKIVAMGDHNAELERRLDAKRSSSRLTKEGDTGPGDNL